MLRVQKTPGSRLVNNIKKRIANDVDLKAMKILIQEQTGNKITGICNSAEPNQPDFCSRNDCFVCQSASSPTKGSCWRTGAVYRITCKVCSDEGNVGVYHGESFHSAYFRMKNHLEALKTRAADSVLDRHCLEVHGGQQLTKEDFKVTVDNNHRHPVSRLSEEGLAIADSARKKDQGLNVFLMNNKSQFYQPGVARASFSRGA